MNHKEIHIDKIINCHAVCWKISLQPENFLPVCRLLPQWMEHTKMYFCSANLLSYPPKCLFVFCNKLPPHPMGLPLPPPYVYTYANIILENAYKQLTIFQATKYTSKRTHLHITNQRLIILLNMQSVVNCSLCFFSDACKVHFNLHAQSTLNELNWQPQLWLYIN